MGKVHFRDLIKLTIHIKTVTGSAVGTSTGAPEALTTLTTIADCEDILGFTIVNTGATVTAGEAFTGTFNINWGGLSTYEWKIPAAKAFGGGPATNIEAVVINPDFIPFLPIGKKETFKGVDIVCSYEAEEPEPTSECDAMFSVWMADGSYPKEVLSNVDRIVTRPKLIKTATEDVSGTDAAKKFGESITIPGGLTEIVAIISTIQLDAAPTHSEEFLGYLQWDTTCPNFSPLETPLPCLHASLGTPVGGSVVSKRSILPMHIPLPNRQTTWTPTAILETVTSGAVAITTALVCR